MVTIAMSHRLGFSASHIKGKSNVCPDLLSRLQTDKALRNFPYLQEEPTQVPLDWLPWMTQRRK